jgi:hypothetical protein
MMETNRNTQKLTLYRPASYQIKVPGDLHNSWAGWLEGINLVVENDPSGMPITTLSGEFDQAALIGLLRRLYSQGLPLVSVVCVEKFSV